MGMMKSILFAALVAAAYADAEPKADADAYYGYYGYAAPYYGYRAYGAYPYYRSYGYHAIGKRSADAEPAADADDYYGYYGYAAPYAYGYAGYRSAYAYGAYPTELDTTDTGKPSNPTKDPPKIKTSSHKQQK